MAEAVSDRFEGNEDVEALAAWWWAHKCVQADVNGNDVTWFLINKVNPSSQNNPQPVSSYPPTNDMAATIAEIERELPVNPNLGAVDDANWVIWRAGIGFRRYYQINHGKNGGPKRCPSAGSYANLAFIRDEQLLSYFAANNTCKL